MVGKSKADIWKGAKAKEELTFDDGSRKVCSALLRMVSPVFEKLLAEGTKKIEVKAATAHEFDAFYSLLLPGYFRSDKITEDNLGSLLALSDHYQSADSFKPMTAA
eukprot:s132_g3.t1